MLEQAEAVCAVDGIPGTDVLDGMTSLVDKSLLRRDEPDGEPRFRMLETIHEFALEQFEASGEANLLRRRHLHALLSLAEEAEPHLRGPNQRAWMQRLRSELDDLRAALAWSAAAADLAEAGLRLAGALGWFWFTLGYLREGSEWLEKVLRGRSDVKLAVRAKALAALGILAWRLGSHQDAWDALHESLRLYREVGDERAVAFVIHHLAHATERQENYVEAIALLEQSLVLSRRLGDTWGTGTSLQCLGGALNRQGDYDRAAPLLDESADLLTRVGDRWALAWTLRWAGIAAEERGDRERAIALFRDGQILSEQLEDKSGILGSQYRLARLALHAGYLDEAEKLFRASLPLARDLLERLDIAQCLEGLGNVAVERGQGIRAARLYGAAAALRQAFGLPIWPADRTHYEQHLADVRAQLSPAAFVAEWAEGQAMNVDQAVAYALTEQETA